MRCLIWAAAGLFGLISHATATEPPRLHELRTQKVDGITYFQARFDQPTDLYLLGAGWQVDRERFALNSLPRLVPQDERTRDVGCFYANLPNVRLPNDRNRRNGSDELTFFGRCAASGRAKLLLIYGRVGSDPGDRPIPVEASVELDFTAAKVVPLPAEAANRQASRPPHADDLEGWWAVTQVERFAVLEAQSLNFGFYGFARAAIARTYHVNAADVFVPWTGVKGPDHLHHLYELTTGAAALTESLQMQRMLGKRREEESWNNGIDIAKVRGIDIAEHNWKKMMGDKTPEPEPLAMLVPHDNYYLHFKRFDKFIEMADFLDQWGTTAVRAYEVQSTDYRLKQRYEKQLCLKTSLLGRTFGPLVIKGLAITGSDPYFREGTDVAVIFQVVNADLFRAGVEPYLREARAEFGDQLREGKEEYQGVAIETFVTPHRGVSLHRASFGDFVVYANSPDGIRRILDTRAGRIKPLADSLDFQYMRTVFKQSDENEDGFLFLSDPFIRQLVGPASKIKEKRRLEGLTGLTMATNAVLWHAWQTGKPPAKLHAALTTAGLTEVDLATPDQPILAWDSSRQLASSERYNTLHFATPLVELPIDRVSTQELHDYNEFREQYLRLWRQYFDPIGMRFGIRNGDVSVESFILPLIQSTQYNDLRSQAGGATISADVSAPTAKTIAQFTTHIAPSAPVRDIVSWVIGMGGANKDVQWLGDWAAIRFDDSPMYAKLAALQESGRQSETESFETFFQLPATVGVQIRNPLIFAGVLTALRTSLFNAAPGTATWEPMEPEYKGIKIVRIQATRQGLEMVDRGGEKKKEPFLPAVYYAMVNGVWYASLQEQPIKDMIDRAEARKKQPPNPKTDTRQINSAVYVSPAAATAAKDFIRGYVEKEVHHRALANAPVWYAFQRTGLLAGKDSEAARQAVLFHYLGYVPLSPDGAAYLFDPRTDEMTNVRHGSLRRPTQKTILDPDSPLGHLLDKTRDIDADLRFREDGVHTTVTIRRQT
jgi:hypothetical protein